MSTNQELIQSMLKAILEISRHTRILDAENGPVHDLLDEADTALWDAVETAKEGNAI